MRSVGSPPHRVLITGGAGYLGSHTALTLIRAGYDVHVLDDLSRSDGMLLTRIRDATGSELPLVRCDIRDRDGMTAALNSVQPDTILHLAALKSVAESVAEPALYHDVNVAGTAVLLHAMGLAGCQRLIYASTAAVYGPPGALPIPETAPLRPGAPYGATKLAGEQLVSEWAGAGVDRRAVLLRYFNPVGASPCGTVGESPVHPPANLVPLLGEVAMNRRPDITIFGTDWPTRDGTGLRDYLHIADIATANLSAVRQLHQFRQATAINIGAGQGHTVHELVAAYARAAGRPLATRTAPRRKGDVAASIADIAVARHRLGWAPALTLDQACRDAWRWINRTG